MIATNCAACQGGPFHFIEYVHVSGGVRSRFVCTAPENAHCREYPECECAEWENCEHPDVTQPVCQFDYWMNENFCIGQCFDGDEGAEAMPGPITVQWDEYQNCMTWNYDPQPHDLEPTDRAASD